MSLQAEVAPAPVLKEQHSAAIRLWHWSNFIIICASLITVLIASTLLKTKYNIPSFQAAAEKTGAGISPEQAKAIARSLNHKLWDWHKYFGFMLATLFLLRILLEFFQSKEEDFFSRIKNARNYLKLHSPELKNDISAFLKSRHYYYVKIIYTVFYISLAVQVLTGLTLAFADDFKFLKPLAGPVKNIHNFNMYVILSYIVIHLAGVILAELGQYKGIVSGMINGK